MKKRKLRRRTYKIRVNKDQVKRTKALLDMALAARKFLNSQIKEAKADLKRWEKGPTTIPYIPRMLRGKK